MRKITGEATIREIAKKHGAGIALDFLRTVKNEIDEHEYEVIKSDLIKRRMEESRIVGSASLEIDISESTLPLEEIEAAVRENYGEGWSFNRTESRYESCIVAIFEM